MSRIDPSWPLGARRLVRTLLHCVGGLAEQVTAQRATIERQARRIKRLNREKRGLRKKLLAALRAVKRQASPFSKGDPKPNPKRPGRKSGADHGPVNLRPRPEHVDETHIATLPLDCPHCGGDVEVDDIQSQFQWDLPPNIRAIIREFKVQIGHCECCGQRLQGRHELQASDALGSAACQIGPRAVAMAGHMNKVLGTPYAKIGVFFSTFLNFDMAASTLVRALLRLARKMEPAYRRIRDLVRTSPVVYPDETGWRIRGVKAWLHVFVGVRVDGRKLVLYVIARYRGFSVAAWALGRTFSGLLGHDGWAPYDQFERAEHQTCHNHLLNRCRRLLEVATRRAVSFPRDLKATIQAAFEARDRYLQGDISYHGLQVVRGQLERRVDALLEMNLSHGGNARLANHVERHEDELFTFLKHPDEIEGTNCYAEQETRPAVIARKISGCNKTWAGAHAHEVLESHFRSAYHAGESGIEWLVEIQRQRARMAQSLPAYLAKSGHT